jgi:hypothetical protein
MRTPGNMRSQPPYRNNLEYEEFPVDDRFRTVPTICQDAIWDLASGRICGVWQGKNSDA